MKSMTKKIRTAALYTDPIGIGVDKNRFGVWVPVWGWVGAGVQLMVIYQNLLDFARAAVSITTKQEIAK